MTSHLHVKKINAVSQGIPILLQNYPTIFWTTNRQILVFWLNICTFTTVQTQKDFEEIILASLKLYMFICKP